MPFDSGTSCLNNFWFLIVSFLNLLARMTLNFDFSVFLNELYIYPL